MHINNLSNAQCIVGSLLYIVHYFIINTLGIIWKSLCERYGYNMKNVFYMDKIIIVIGHSKDILKVLSYKQVKRQTLD
jgi:hypothetical protein